MNIKIYTIPGCEYCVMAKDYLSAEKVSYENIDVFENREAAKEMIDKSGQMGVPVLDIDGKIIIGFDEREIERTLGRKKF